MLTHPDGSLYLAVNTGDGSGSTPPTFTNIGKIKDRESSYAQANVRLGDIDGGGRGHYYIVAENRHTGSHLVSGLPVMTWATLPASGVRISMEMAALIGFGSLMSAR